MRPTSRVTSTAAGLAVAALALTGCGAQNSASDNSSDSTSSSATTSQTMDPAPSTPSSQAPSSTQEPSSSSSEASESSSSTTSSSSTPAPSTEPTRTRTVAPSTTSESSAPESSSTSSSASSSEDGAATGGTNDGDGSDDAKDGDKKNDTDSGKKPDAKDGDKKDEDAPKDSSTPGSYAGDTLKMGDTGSRVTAAQQRLAQLGYWTPSPDGSYGGGTRQAIYAVQKAAGIKRSGELDADTQKALQSGVTPKARTSTRGLEFDVSKQLLLVVDGGKVVRTINASSGNGEKFTYPVKDAAGKVVRHATTHANTPAGSYDIYFERDENWESTLELGSLYRPKYFDGGIAVHGASSVPPYPASHGCVRVTNATMDWLWSSGYANKKAPVTVY